jgi:hypothetical protein
MSVGNAGPDVSARFVFAVSLKPRSACADWEQAQANLRRTIRSALQGAAGNTIVVVACHDVPELDQQNGGAVRICPVSFPEPVDVSEGGRDKARKRRHIGAWLRGALLDDELHVMFLDADDLVHKDLVPYVLDHGHDSYLVDRGYVVDVASGLVRHRRTGFHLTCGSSFICRFARDELPSSWEDDASFYGQFGASPEQRGHQEYGQVAAGHGRAPVTVPFQAVAYLVNHGESMWAAKGRGKRRVAGPRELISSRAACRIVAEDFAAPDLARKLAGRGGVARAFVGASRRRLIERLSALASRDESGRRP